MAGRPPTYQADEDRPISVSLRMPKALYAQAQQRVHQRRMTLTEALLDGLQLWLETPADPRDLLLSDESNTVMQQLQEMVTATVQAELAKLLSAPMGAQTLPNTTDSGNTVLHETHHTEPLVPDDMRQCKRGLHTYPATLRECPECRRATKRAYKQRQREKAAGA